MNDPFSNNPDAPQPAKSDSAPAAGSGPVPSASWAGLASVRPSCPNCGRPADNGQLFCPSCGTLVFQRRLEQLAQEAQLQEQTDPREAVMIWRRCLPLLPPGSPQARAIEQHINHILYPAAPPSAQPPSADENWGGGVQLPAPGDPHYGYSSQADPQNGGPQILSYATPARPQSHETPLTVLFKTGGSMVISAVAMYYMYRHSWVWAVGFVVLLLCHELGHTLANWHYGLRQSPPIFLPFLGGIIILLDPPRNARVEAVVGISGPITGTLAAIGALVLAGVTHNAMIADVARFALVLNLFNLLPLPPLDGGRTAAAITPWLWVIGGVGIVLLALLTIASGLLGGGSINVGSLFIVWYLLSSAIPRIRATLRPGMSRNPYFKIGWVSRLVITLIYVGLILFLVASLGLIPHRWMI